MLKCSGMYSTLKPAYWGVHCKSTVAKNYEQINKEKSGSLEAEAYKYIIVKNFTWNFKWRSLKKFEREVFFENNYLLFTFYEYFSDGTY